MSSPNLVQACVVGLNANALQDLLDVLGPWVFIATKGREQVSSNVTHPERGATDKSTLTLLLLKLR